MVCWGAGGSAPQQPVMARAKRRRHQSNRPVVLVFAESLNDARALRSLIEALCPSLEKRVRVQVRPPSLQRSAGQQPVRKWMNSLCHAIDGISRNSSVACVFVHRDSDGPDPRGQLQSATEALMRRAGISNGHAVVPVEEMEAWWLLFPQATEGFRTTWAGTLPKSRRTVDSISGPKEELMRRTGAKDRKKAYSEADSPEVAKRVASAIASGQAPTGISPSFDRFKLSVSKCCE